MCRFVRTRCTGGLYSWHLWHRRGGWAPYYVRHELIHHVQNERLGSLRTWLFKPAWFVEGMAYSISEDPRSPLPARFEVYRSQFDAWYRAVGTEGLWSAAEAL
jgi:hypothetical protein